MEAAPRQVTFKAFYNKEVRRLNFNDPASIAFDVLYTRLSKLFSITHFKIHYEDEDGDAIVIDHDNDLKEALVHLYAINKNELRLVVKLTLEKSEDSPKGVEKKSPPEVDNPINISSNSPETNSISSENEAQSLPTNNKDSNDPIERVINSGIKNIQDLVQTFLTQISNIEQDLFPPPNSQQSRDMLQRETSTQSAEMLQILQSQTTSTSEPVHYGIICDHCNEIIRGMRWNCTKCSNYDLCKVCKSKQPSVHPDDHDFRSIPYPSTSSNAAPHSAICDYCESVIFGIRHKCINCPDFDLCDRCIPLTRTQHPSHTFVPIRRPGEIEIKAQDTTPHRGVKCDGCGKAINGVRYKCGNCIDFDLCGNCEASPLNKHEPSHVFIKIRRPVTRSLSLCDPLLPNFYINDSECCSDLRRRPFSIFPIQSNPPSSVQAQNNVKDNVSSPKLPVTSRAPVALYEQPQNDVKKTSQSSPSITTSSSLSSYFIPRVEEQQKPIKYITVDSPIKSHTFMASFVEDVNVPDGTVLPSQAQFIKIWKMHNNGEVAWPETTALYFIGGKEMFNESLLKSGQGENARKFHVGAVQPNQTVCISADLQAPSEPGKYKSYWRLMDGEQHRFGHRVWCEIIVEPVDQSSSMSSSMIFPVLTYEQEAGSQESESSVSVKSVSQTVPAPLPSPPVRTSDGIVDGEEDPFRDPTEAELKEEDNKPFDVDSTNSISEINASESESDATSIISESSSSQDFIVIDRFEEETQRSNDQSLKLNHEERESDTQSEVKSLTTTDAQDTSVSQTTSAVDENDDTTLYKDELNKLEEMGFKDRDFNLSLLLQSEGDFDKVLEHCLNQ